MISQSKPSIFHCIPKISQIPLTFPIKFLRFSVPPVEIIHGPQGLSAQFANAVGRGDCYLGAVELRMENPFITENIVKSPNDLVKPWKTLGEYDRYYLLLCFLYGLGALSTTNNHQ